MTILHPVGDGFSLGTLQIVGGNGDGVTRFEVLSPSRDDANYVQLKFEQGAGFDTVMQASGPISFGDGVMRGRFAVIGSDDGIEVAGSLWGADPRYALDTSRQIAETKNFTIWNRDWQEYAIPLYGRQTDRVAEFMGSLWFRFVIVSAQGGSVAPVVGVSALWIETPTASRLAFSADFSTVPENTLVTVRTFSGRTAQARRIGGEWFDENGLPFEIDKHSLPVGSDGNIQTSRAINGWGQ